MAIDLSERVFSQVELARGQYHRLVILVGPKRSGKTRALSELSRSQGWPLLNVNLLLSSRLLELTSRQRALRVAPILDDIVINQGAEIVLLDNIEMLFHPALKQNPLRLLQSLSRNRTITAAWRGVYSGTSLTYASPDHPEFQRFESPQALFVCSNGGPGDGGMASAQEQ